MVDVYTNANIPVGTSISVSSTVPLISLETNVTAVSDLHPDVIKLQEEIITILDILERKQRIHDLEMPDKINLFLDRVYFVNEEENKLSNVSNITVHEKTFLVSLKNELDANFKSFNDFKFESNSKLAKNLKTMISDLQNKFEVIEKLETIETSKKHKLNIYEKENEIYTNKIKETVSIYKNINIEVKVKVIVINTKAPLKNMKLGDTSLNNFFICMQEENKKILRDMVKETRKQIAARKRKSVEKKKKLKSEEIKKDDN